MNFLTTPLAYAFTVQEEEYSNGLEIEPFYLEASIVKGEVYKDSIRVKNATDAPITFTVEVVPYTSVDSNITSFEVQTSESKIVDWTSVLNYKESGITLEAGETRNFGFTIDVPRDVDSGVQKEVIMFKATTPNEFGNFNNLGFMISANIVNPFPAFLIVVVGVVVIILGLAGIFLLRRHKQKKASVAKGRKPFKNGK